MRKCSKCGQLKDESEYYKNSWASDGLRSDCKSCFRILKIRRPNNPTNKICSTCFRELPKTEFTSAKRGEDGLRKNCKRCVKNTSLRAKFNITIEEYEKMDEDQDSLCLICHEEEVTVNKFGEIRGLAVDHDHETGIIRGLLCFACNTGLGSFKDDVNLLKKAQQYLQGDW